MPVLVFLFLVFLLAVVVSCVSTARVRAVAVTLKLVSAPTLDRHVHSTPVPRLGGVAVFTALALVVLSSGILVKHVAVKAFDFDMRQCLTRVIIAGGMVFAIGVYDDLRGCSAWPKLAVEAVAGTILFFSGVKIGDFGLHGRPGTLACYGLTLCLVIAVTNGFNLIDGMDGLAAGSAALSTMAIAVIGLMNHSGAAVLLAVALAGALVGFLRFNFSPASIFLGDGGSLFIGFTLSAAAMLAVQNMRTSQTVITPALVFAIPVLEVCVSVLRRRLRGRSIFCADRDHFHHRLLLRGFSHRQAVIALYGASAVSALLGLLLLYCAARARVPVLISFLACTAVLIRWLKYEELCQFPLSLLAARSRRPRWVDMHGSLSRTV